MGGRQEATREHIRASSCVPIVHDWLALCQADVVCAIVILGIGFVFFVHFEPLADATIFVLSIAVSGGIVSSGFYVRNRTKRWSEIVQIWRSEAIFWVPIWSILHAWECFIQTSYNSSEIELSKYRAKNTQTHTNTYYSRLVELLATVDHLFSTTSPVGVTGCWQWGKRTATKDGFAGFPSSWARKKGIPSQPIFC